jgi:hypothetical protein
MTGSPPEPEGRADELLGVAAGAGPAEVRAAFLRRLEEADFVPPPVWLRAYESLGGRRLPAEEGREGGQERLAAEERLREEVEELALQFFTWAAPERRRRWQALVARCAPYPPLAARARALGAGLLLDPLAVPDHDPLVKELAGYVGELFVLRPAARAARRQELLARMKGEIARWEAAARSLKKQHAALADLEPELVRRLSRWTATRQELARARRRASKVGRPAAPAQSSALRWLAWLLIGLIAAGLRTTTCGPNYQSPSYQPSTDRPPPAGEIRDIPAVPNGPRPEADKGFPVAPEKWLQERDMDPEVRKTVQKAWEQMLEWKRKRDRVGPGPGGKGGPGGQAPAVRRPDNPPPPEAVPPKAAPP